MTYTLSDDNEKQNTVINNGDDIDVTIVSNANMHHNNNVDSKYVNKQNNDPHYSSLPTQVYRKRYLILFIFALFSMSNAFQWIQYSIVATVIAPYYGVSEFSINMTSMIFMILYIPGIIPASWLLSRWPLRRCILLGSGFNCLGTLLKCFSADPSMFWLTMAGQTLVATAQLFILNIPPMLAGVWFPRNEVSSATSFGVFGNQLGIAIGFILPPMIIDPANIQRGLQLLYWSCFGVTSVLFLVKLLWFTNEPEQPPSEAAALKRLQASNKLSCINNDDNLGKNDLKSMLDGSEYLQSIFRLFRSSDYILLLISYGVNVGVFYAISTLLEQMISSQFPGSTVDAGRCGLLLTVAGMFGSVLSGFALDRTHKYKEITLIIYCMTLFGLIQFSCALHLYKLWPLYFISAFLGFFMTGYLPIGFEFAAEITYPEPEGTTAGLLNASAQVFGIIFTLIASHLLKTYGDFYANIAMSIALFVGTLMTAKVRNELKRQNACKNPVISC